MDKKLNILSFLFMILFLNKNIGFQADVCFTKSGLILSHQPFFGVYHQVLLHPYIFEQSEPFALQ